MNAQDVAEAIRIALGSLFVFSAFLKIIRPEALDSVLRFLAIPHPSLCARLIVGGEIVMGIWLLSDMETVASMIVAGLTLMVFTCVLAILKARRYEGSCACLGNARGRPVSLFDIFRNCALIVAAGTGFVIQSNAPQTIPDLPSIEVFVFSMTALGLGAVITIVADHVIALRPHYIKYQRERQSL